MNWGVVLPIIAVIIGLNILDRTRPISLLLWTAIWWLAIYIFLSFGIAPPVPVSIISEYMIIASMSLLVYIISDEKRLKSVKDPLYHFMTESKYQSALIGVLILIPVLVGLKIYLNSQVEILPPGFSRSVHPAPPDSINFKGKKIDLIKGENPFRKLQTSDKAKFAEHVQNGRKVYYENCYYCHGDAMLGKGHLAYGLDPIPTNFQDPATIGMLSESFLFWRIAKGGRGLPGEGGPWASAMPAWEDFLDEDDIWDVILFLYDYTGNKPRAIEHH
ncbi:hypothetical protein BVY03_02270 [bacterium K02(2017)]|nr:hypothetical protein BVY03_02270 [bacterium K02(2017)]